MGRVWTLPLALLLAQPGLAQDPAAAPPSYQQLKAEYDAAYKAWLTKYRGAADQAEQQKIIAEMPAQKFGARFLAGAEAHKGTDAAIDFLTWVMNNDPNSIEPAVEQLLADHVEHEKMGQVASRLRYASYTLGKDKVLSAYGTIIEKNPSDAVKAQAYFGRGAILLEDPEATDAQKKAGEADVEQVAKLSDDARLIARAKGTLFEANNLAIGMVAPEIEGEDLDGVAFKLSDYRGKVVVLDFWGDW